MTSESTNQILFYLTKVHWYTFFFVIILFTFWLWGCSLTSLQKLSATVQNRTKSTKSGYMFSWKICVVLYMDEQGRTQICLEVRLKKKSYQHSICSKLFLHHSAYQVFPTAISSSKRLEKHSWSCGLEELEPGADRKIYRVWGTWCKLYLN